MPIVMHSDGQIQAILPDLVEIGLTALNPVQPEVLNHRQLKAQFGRQLAFYGGISTQTVLPHGSPDQVRAAVRQCIEDLAPDGGGLMLAPSHRMMSDIPLENVDAMLSAFRQEEPVSVTERRQLLLDEFASRFGGQPAACVRAPGRVDLMGSHTDYNLGYVMTHDARPRHLVRAAPARRPDRFGAVAQHAGLRRLQPRRYRALRNRARGPSTCGAWRGPCRRRVTGWRFRRSRSQHDPVWQRLELLRGHRDGCRYGIPGRFGPGDRPGPAWRCWASRRRTSLSA